MKGASKYIVLMVIVVIGVVMFKACTSLAEMGNEVAQVVSPTYIDEEASRGNQSQSGEVDSKASSGVETAESVVEGFKDEVEKSKSADETSESQNGGTSGLSPVEVAGELVSGVLETAVPDSNLEGGSGDVEEAIYGAVFRFIKNHMGDVE